MIDLTGAGRLPKFSTDLPLTPMIDVVFLLLIFFVSIQFKRLAGLLEAQLPPARGVINRLDIRERLIDRHIRVRVVPVRGWQDTFGARSQDASAVELQRVTVEVEGRDLLRDLDADPDTVTNTRLFDVLVRRLVDEKEWRRDMGKTPVVVLDLDRELNFQNVVSTVNAARRARFGDISFLPPAGEGRDE